MTRIGILYFHQGWTDIINCLSLINHYCKLYDTIYLIMRKDAKQIIDFYTKDLKNIKIVYEAKIILDKQNPLQYFKTKNNELANELTLNNIDILGIGVHDKSREDEFKNKFKNNSNFFVNAFYENYNIPYQTRIQDFTFNRNKELENNTYNEFIAIHGKDYIIYHEVIEDYDKTKKIINLNGISSVFFDMIQVLENAEEIHLLDSVWGAFIYQLDAKYKLFQNKKIVLYAKRGYHQMFTQPVTLPNWIIHG
jgi:hypothetical protein